MSNDKKPFKETGLGKILLGVIPGFIKGASKALPDSGVLGVIKNLIDTDPDMSDEEKAQAHDQLVELYRLEVEDRDSARKREAAIVNAGGKDWMMTLTGIVGLAAFGFIVYTVVTTNVPPQINSSSVYKDSTSKGSNEVLNIRTWSIKPLK